MGSPKADDPSGPRGPPPGGARGRLHHTGGACYGFTTEPEANPPGPEHPRMVVRVDPEQAKVVRRIFREYAAGGSLARICDALNAEGVPAPQDGSTKKGARGWARSLLHFMLRNERYTGRVVWNRREWFRDPLTKRRRYRERPESEWLVGEGPAVIDSDTWANVQTRHKANARPGAALAFKTTAPLVLVQGGRFDAVGCGGGI